jgi:hypothetical protein
MRMTTKAALILGVLLQAALAMGQPSEHYRPILVKRGQVVYVFRVSTSGSVQRLPLRLSDFGCGFAKVGLSDPLMSPDGHWIALTRNQELRLLDMSSYQETPLTWVNRDCPDSLAWVVWITQWSADSRHLLYRVTRHPFVRWRPGCYGRQGYFIYDVDADTTLKIELPGFAECWLPNGDFVLSTDLDAEYTSFLLGGGPDLVWFAPGDTLRHFFSAASGCDKASCFDNIRCNPQGSHLAMYYRPTGGIVELEIATGQLTEITGPADAPSVHGAFYSPGGQHLAWLERNWSHRAFTEALVRVDGETVLQCPSWLYAEDISWVSDSTVVVACRDSLYVVDVQSGCLQNRPVRISEVPNKRKHSKRGAQGQ